MERAAVVGDYVPVRVGRREGDQGPARGSGAGDQHPADHRRQRQRAAFAQLASELGGLADHALEVLEAGLEDAIAVLHLPEKYRRRLRSTNPLERLIEEGRRHERVIRIFPNERSA